MMRYKLEGKFLYMFDDNNNIYMTELTPDLLSKTNEEMGIISQQKYNEIKFKEANPPLPSYQELRAKEYLEKGITTDKLIIALWEKVVEGRNESADLIQAERIAIKAKYPKI